MKKFYSKSTGGFYSTEIHGDPEMTIVDPAWVRPLISIDLKPGESVTAEIDGESRTVTNDTDADITVTDVPDMSVEPATLTIANPDCRIPADAVEVAPADYVALLDAQEAGKVILADKKGRPVAADRPPLSASEQAKLDIAALEAQVTPRRIREAILGTDGGWLANIDSQIAALRAAL